MTGKYDDMLYLPHPISKKHPRMPMINRAAQFSPFAALTGYDTKIKDTERQTEARHELSDDQKVELDRKKQILLNKIKEQPKVSITYYVPDERKEGGAHLTVEGNLKKINEDEDYFVFVDGSRIWMEDIIQLESEVIEDDF